MPKDLYCDKCGSPENATEDYDGAILCDYHRAESDLFYLKREYSQKRAWVKSVWISRLVKMRKEIRDLEKKIDRLNPARNSPSTPTQGDRTHESTPSV